MHSPHNCWARNLGCVNISRFRSHCRSHDTLVQQQRWQLSCQKAPQTSQWNLFFDSLPLQYFCKNIFIHLFSSMLCALWKSCSQNTFSPFRDVFPRFPENKLIVHSQGWWLLRTSKKCILHLKEGYFNVLKLFFFIPPTQLSLWPPVSLWHSTSNALAPLHHPRFMQCMLHSTPQYGGMKRARHWGSRTSWAPHRTVSTNAVCQSKWMLMW